MKIGIIGGAGRMGRMLIKEVLSTQNCSLAGAVEHGKNPLLGKDLGLIIGEEAAGVTLTDNLEKLISSSDAIIDFTTPSATINAAELCAANETAHIIGTTGIDGDGRAKIEKFAKKTPIVMSSNMSIGVNLLIAAVEQAAAKLDDSYDIEIVEMHHKHKVDSPSGTALALGSAAADGRKVALSDVQKLSREGIVGARPRGEIGFATLRGGDVIGDHTVIFAGEGERIEFTHKASGRQIYSRGAVRAALWTKGRKPGLYSMKDVLSS